MGTDHDGYIARLRQHIGHAAIIMSSAGCVVQDGAGRVLLQQRDDPGQPWGLPGGAMELGETVAETAVRETREETGIDVELTDLLGVYSVDLHTYANGDVVQPVVVMFTAAAIGGALKVDGIETRDVGWFRFDELPTPIFGTHSLILRDAELGRRGVWT